MNGIFISYRRDDSAGYAGRLYDRLAAHFGVDRVFMDVEGIEPGTDFVDAIERAIASCRVLIVLIGDEWLSAADTSGRRRLDDPNDFIRLETSAALARDIRVVPVLLDGALMPNENDLPDNLKPLVRRQAVELTHKQWEASSGELIRTLERILAADDAPQAAQVAQVANAADGTAASGEAHHSKAWMLGFIAAIAIAIGIALWLRDKPPPMPEPVSVTEPASTPMPETPPPEAVPPADPAVAATDTEPQVPADEPPVEAPRPARLETTTPRLAFADTETGQMTSSELRLTNTGETEAPLNARVLGESAGSYNIIGGTCGDTLAPAATCNYSIAFEPASTGARPAELIIDFGAAAPLVVALDAAAVAPAPVPAEAPAPPVTEPPQAIPETPPPRPVIQTLTSTPVAGGAKICYRVEHADALALSPQPGDIGDSPSDCVTVPLSRETTLTLVAIGPGGQAAVRVVAAPEPRALEDAPAPAAVADAAPPDESADSALPARGDTWTYRTRGKWATSPKRTIVFEVENVASGVINERYFETAPRASTGVAKRSRAGDAAIVDWGAAGWEFSPWLAAGRDHPESMRWRGFSAPAMNGEWGNWNTTASVGGKARITVPAGTFTTLRVDASASRAKTGGRGQAMLEPVQVKFSVWYSPKVKRYVKMERSVISASRDEIEQDTFELVEYNTR